MFPGDVFDRRYKGLRVKRSHLAMMERMAKQVRDDYDKTREWERNDEQARYDEAQDNASRERADAYDREHSEDVP